MTTAHKLTTGLAIALALILCFAGYGWLKEHDARIRTEATTSSQQQQVDALKAQEKDAAATLASALKVIQAQRSAPPPTPQQFVVDVAKLMPNLPQPVTVETVPAKVDASGKVDAPTQRIVIPEADIPAFNSYKLDCDEKAVRLTACSAQSAAVKQELVVTTKQRDEWETTAKGGSKWHRALTAAKYIGIGIGVGAVVGFAAH